MVHIDFYGTLLVTWSAQVAAFWQQIREFWREPGVVVDEPLVYVNINCCNPTRGWLIIINDVITAFVSVWCGCHGNGSALWCGAAVGFHLCDDHVLGYRSVRSCSNSWVQWSRFPDFCPCQSNPIRQKRKETESRYLTVVDYSKTSFCYYRRSGSCGKAMFSQVSFILSSQSVHVWG